MKTGKSYGLIWGKGWFLEHWINWTRGVFQGGEFVSGMLNDQRRQDQYLLVSEQGGSEGITSPLFLFGACFATSAFSSNTDMCPSWVTHILQFLTSWKTQTVRGFCYWVPLHKSSSQWQVIFDRIKKPGKGNKLFSRDAKNSQLFSLLHPGASGKRGLAHLKYTDEKCLFLTS